MRDGPTVVVQEYRSCLGCRWLDHRMVMSGMHPIYENSCTHPDADVPCTFLSEFLRRGRFIGRSDVTPEWCPVLPR